MKNAVIIYLLICANMVFAQKTELNLSDAVMQQYRKFAPQSIRNFMWIPNTDSYVFLDNYTTLKKADVKNSQAKTLMTIQECNENAGAKLQYFSGLSFLSENEFILNDGINYYTYNLDSKKSTSIIQLPENAQNALLHPETKSLAYTIDNNVYLKNSNADIQVTNISDKNIVSGQAIARSEFGISGGLFWSPKGNFLAFYQKDETNVSDYPLLDNNAYPGTLTSIKYPMAGQPSEKPRVGIFNIQNKNIVYIKPTGDSEDYLTNLSFTPDEKFILIAEVNRDQNHYKLNLYDARTGEFIKTLLEEKNDKWVEPEHPAFFPDSESNNFIWISEKDGFANMYYYDINGNLLKQLTNNKFVCKEIVASDEKNKTVYFYATGDSPLNTMLYKVNLKGIQQLITLIPGTHTCSISTTGNFIYDSYSSHDSPAVNQILTNNGKIFTVLNTGKSTLDEYKIGSSEIGTIKGKDGTDLYYRLIKPSNFDVTKKYPVLVYVYGGPHAQMITNSWLDGASLWMYWMAEQGYLIFTLDNRGSANRGFAFESQIHRQLGKVEMEDQLTGIEYLKSLPYVDGDRLAVHGWSFGGFMTTSLMLRQQGIFNVGVAGGPVTDWKYYEIMYGERYMDRPEQNPEGYKENSLMEYVKNLEGDLLLIHGTVDDVVVMQHNLALVQKFIENDIEIDFFPYPMHKHNVYGKDRVHLMNKILNYVLENNN